MGLADKVIKRLEQQADTIAQYRQLDEKRRARICELERKLGDAEREHDIARVEIETLRQERDAAQAALTRERLNAEERNELNCRQQKGGE